MRRTSKHIRKSPFTKIAELILNPSPIFRFLTSRWGHCRVPGCKRFTHNPLCRKHQGSPKFQYLAQRTGR